MQPGVFCASFPSRKPEANRGVKGLIMRILFASCFGFFGESPTRPCFNKSQGLGHLLLEVSRILALPRDDVQEDDLLMITGIQVK